jgi:Type II secretion system (T2SS), protein K
MNPNAPHPDPDAAPHAQTRLRRLWRVLMTPVGHRIPVTLPGRKRRGAPHGVALLMVLLALALMSAVVTDLGANEMVRYRLASNERDSVKAAALAESGTNIARLLLTMQSAIQPCITMVAGMGIPLPANTFWQLVPLDSELLKGLTSGELQTTLGLDVTAALEERRAKLEAQKEEALANFEADAEGAGLTPFSVPEGGFGLFDGTFKAEIQDEEQKAASLRGWSGALGNACFAYAQRLFRVFQPERYDFLFEDRDGQGNRTDRYELVANLYDWVDGNQDQTDGRADVATWCRGAGGSEDSVYSSGYKVQPRNAYFDSTAELRLVRGITDAHLRAFGEQLSVYGEGKTNILSAPLSTIESLIYGCAQPGDPLVENPTWMQETLQLWQEWKTLGPMGGGGASTPEGFMSFLDTRGLVVTPECQNQITTESRNFTVKASATVGDVTRTMTTVMRIYGNNEETYYFSIR